MAVLLDMPRQYMFLSHTRGKIRDHLQDTTIAVERSRRTDMSRGVPMGEDIELGVDEGSRCDGFRQSIE